VGATCSPTASAPSPDTACAPPVMSSDTAGLPDGDLSGWTLGLGLAFGGRKKPVLE